MWDFVLVSKLWKQTAWKAFENMQQNRLFFTVSPSKIVKWWTSLTFFRITTNLYKSDPTWIIQKINIIMRSTTIVVCNADTASLRLRHSVLVTGKSLDTWNSCFKRIEISVLIGIVSQWCNRTMRFGAARSLLTTQPYDHLSCTLVKKTQGLILLEEVEPTEIMSGLFAMLSVIADSRKICIGTVNLGTPKVVRRPLGFDNPYLEDLKTVNTN